MKNFDVKNQKNKKKQRKMKRAKIQRSGKLTWKLSIHSTLLFVVNKYTKIAKNQLFFFHSPYTNALQFYIYMKNILFYFMVSVTSFNMSSAE